MLYKLFLAGLFTFTLTSLHAEESAWTPLYNGKDLTGWKVPGENPWWVAQGETLHAQSDPAKKGNTLWTEKEYTDVEFEGEFKFSGNIDSGVFFRKPDLQVQIGTSRSLKKDMTASIYIPKKGYDGKARGVPELLKVDDWNRLRVKAKGDVFTVWLNGTQVLEYTSNNFPGAAPIGLQIHPGVDMQIDFRNLRVREI